MKYSISAILILLSFMVYGQQKPVKKPAPSASVIAMPLKSLDDSLSYAIGISMAKQYSSQGVKNINGAVVARGVNDFMQKSKMILDQDQCQIVLLSVTKPEAAKRVKSGLQFLAENKKRPGIMVTPSGLQYEVLRDGNGERPAATDSVQVSYLGTLIDGSEFDNSYKRGAPITFPLNGVIKGWTEGLQLMVVGAKYRFYIPHQLAYGTTDRGPKIPGGSVLIFEVELLQVKKSI